MEVNVNVFLSLSDEELDALEDFWAEQIGQGNERQSDMAVKRIEQLRMVRTQPLDFVMEAAA